MIDLSKASNTVPHDKVLGKLQYYGIQGPFVDWIKSIDQCVVVDVEKSEPVTVDSGVQQRTILWPFIFLTRCCNIYNCLFADDCLVYRVIRTMEDQIALQKDLDSLVEYAKQWRMTFNVTICNIVRISRACEPLLRFYTLAGHVLEEVTEKPNICELPSQMISAAPLISLLPHQKVT